MKILNFGSLNIDHVYSVDHFVTAGETTAASSLSYNVGGKGLNQSIALAKAGSNVFHAGCVGNDGEFLTKFLYDNNVNIDYIDSITGPTGHAIIQVDKSGQNCILLFGGANIKIAPIFVDNVLSSFTQGDYILLQNEINCLDYIMNASYKKGIKILLNPSPISDSLKSLPLNLVDTFILNEVEGFELTSKSIPDEIISKLLESYPNSKFVLTLGKNGSIYADKNSRYFQEIFKVKAVDTTAAGDTFTGYFINGLLRGMSIQEVLRRASYASSIAVTRKGAAVSIPLYNEVDGKY